MALYEVCRAFPLHTLFFQGGENVKQIDQLFVRALKIKSKRAPRFHMAFLSLDGKTGKWGLRIQIVKGGGVECIDTEHASREQAEKQIEKMMIEYPNWDYIPAIIYDDLDQ